MQDKQISVTVVCNVQELSHITQMWLDNIVIGEEGAYYHCISNVSYIFFACPIYLKFLSYTVLKLRWEAWIN
jgi:hypothetical protein